MLRLAFTGSSSFVIPILNNILNNRGRSLAAVATEQINLLDTHTLPTFFQDSIAALLTRLPSVELLHAPLSAPLIITQSPSQNRGKTVHNPVYRFALDNQLKILAPTKLNLVADDLISSQLDLMLVASYGQILSNQVLAAPKHGCINWHPSALPKYRGPTPMQTTLAEGNTTTALSWIEMELGMDSGPLLLQVPISVSATTTIVELAKQTGDIGSQTWAIAACLQISGLTGQTQDESQATFCQMLSKDDKNIDHTLLNATEIYNHWRAYQDYPGSVVQSKYFRQPIKILTCDSDFVSTQLKSIPNFLNQSAMLEPDQVFDDFYKTKNQVFLICRDQTLLPVQSIQLLEVGSRVNLSGYHFENKFEL